MKLRITIRVLVALTLVSVSSDPLPAQTLSLTSSYTRDEIPDRIYKTDVSYRTDLGEMFAVSGGYHYFFADEEAFQGLPHLRKALHTLDGLVTSYFAGRSLECSLGGALHAAPGSPSDGDYYASLRYRQAVGGTPEQPPLRIELAGEAARRRELSVATALDEGISYRECSLTSELNIWNELTLGGKYSRQFYSDDNQKTVAYAYALLTPVSDPLISVGYAFAYSNSLFDNWRLTATRRIAFDPITRKAIYDYSYFYYPYFTPMKEQGHLLIGIIRSNLSAHLFFYGKASVAIHSHGLNKYFPATGDRPAPVDYGLYYDVDGVQPSQYEASLASDFFDPVSVRLNAEYFSKTYYSYFTIGAAVEYHLDQ